ncbi:MULTISPECIES: NAD-dependent epimerase/dehydratase family protein [unclassified Streptomyces]|uniref:NAD-dependent epimerase/dehydratase family protein n=1 Tax=unclassified Streptomyces TaxID=2593676 RepID=UPI00136E52D3|nr:MULTISPECIES: NAD-dependent epimerase/dehydratase family protein [unclassified Streptomyces]NDZ98504.1 NAD-dependent epimerase/dehydratase family protein [Streptomyces sp. SID10116]MYY79769.1 NAD-dependent epimerase/dehydratase family protein [Streptomyces sp. SID335]MYZ16527.1 NAD-dependent epimerase/dehydratase family protein [Streptomyces sp. SID337]NDZ84494.1 NAD-dependent epimerase/dehydratase family protein [Streptomyces sp. SID10115]NEB43457.1 NAD-dependent epimerase/dehydratase fami
MRVLLTGHKGFVGRHLHAAMDGRGWDVDGVDLLHGGADALDLFRHENTRYDLAIHCAAVVGGRASIDGSPLGVATNLALDSWYFRWLVRTGTPRAVYFSSSAAYPIALQQPGPIHRLVETDIDYAQPGRPDATYGLAKLAGEQLARYAEAEGTRIHILRPFSGYGEDQADCYPFPAFIRRAKQRQDPFEIWGDGSSTRDWIHVSDLVAATLAAVDQDFTGPVNLGWGRPVSFDELAGLATTMSGYQPELKHLPTAPQGVHHRVCDPKRMLDFFSPKISLEEGIQRALNT